MGTCCSNRTDISGQEKAAGGKKNATTGATKDGSGVKFNPMDAVRNTITQVLKDSKSRNTIRSNFFIDSHLLSSVKS